MRPVRPFPYFEKSQRIKNNTPRSDESWHRIVDESIQYDKEFDKWQGSARAELQNLPEIKPLEQIRLSSLYNLCVFDFEEHTGQKFDVCGDEYLKTLIYYCFDNGLFGYMKDQFSIQSNVVKSIHGVNLSIKKSKGIFIVGNFGTGKTKIAESVRRVIFNSISKYVADINGNYHSLKDYSIAYPRIYSGFKLITSSTIKQAHESKNGLYELILAFNHLMIDDLFSEDKSFGKDVLIEVIEERYSKGLKTSVICNYQGDSIESTLTAYGERYGSRLFDRAFEMFNFVEVKGKSKRK